MGLVFWSVFFICLWGFGLVLVWFNFVWFGFCLVVVFFVCLFLPLGAVLKIYIDKERQINCGLVSCSSPPIAAIHSLVNQGTLEQSAFQRHLPKCRFSQI